MVPTAFAAIALIVNSPVAEVPDGVPQVRMAVESSLAMLQEKGFEWETIKCVSCHHGPWMMWTGYEAKKHGFTVN